ncbi:FAD/NAD(P)-binding protein [Massilia sp. R2A-15]|uniref:FAD/NAD(P)-binding protein n=1 Tax=Massilia sp. R2A-15 TaxID=3064278 RepID=UPI002734ACC6|nr:FAD/NAD(P)-binding domain-containing protein [Massilia sp. R2A-15]WLI88507.1 FAD/NAD(P)-binding protein [Massilia sp. R2A-15]
MVKIAIIGLGPRGISVFDRIIAYARNDASATPLELYLFDSKEFGPGCHTTDQADHLLVNTVACQMTQFSDDTVRGAGPLLYGPSFADWLASRNSMSGIGPKEEIDRNGYYSRALFGDYLRWGFEYLKKLAPPHMTIFLHNYAGVDDLEWKGERWTVSYDGCGYPADFVFLTTGHARKVLSEPERALTAKVEAARSRNARLQLVLEPYPIRNAVSSVTASDTIAIEGMGLTSFDLISQLTAGRGGKFESCGKMEPAARLRYRPSGQEPKILLYSRSGLPLTARAVNQKGVFGQYKPKFLTFAKVEQLRRESGGGQLDFEKQIIPLLWCDMQFAYYFAYLHHKRDKIAALMFSNEFMACENGKARQALIDRHIDRREQLSWEKLVDPIPPLALKSRRQFDDWLRGHMWRDVEHALRGNLDSPVKSACDVLRDVRDVVRSAIDFGGLYEHSHRWVLSEFLPIMNRLAVGPPKERIAQLLALMDAGTVRADFGPGAHSTLDEGNGCFVVHSHWQGDPVTANVLVRGRASLPGPLEDKSPLMRKLVQRGIVRPFTNGQFHPGGITVDRNMNVVAQDGSSQTTLWALGTLVEGCKFYTFVLPRPGANSTTMVDAGRAVGLMMDAIAERCAKPVPAPVSAQEAFEPVALRLVSEPEPEIVHCSSAAMVQS